MVLGRDPGISPAVHGFAASTKKRSVGLLWVNRVLRASTSGERRTGVHRNLTFPARLGKPVRHPGHASPTQEDDHGDPSASNVLNAATRALEQGQAHRAEAAVAAK